MLRPGVSINHSEANHPDQIAALVAVSCDRLSDIVPSKQFDLAVEARSAIRFVGRGSREGSTSWLTPNAFWHAQAPVEARLEFFLDAVASTVQRLLSTPN